MEGLVWGPASRADDLKGLEIIALLRHFCLPLDSGALPSSEGSSKSSRSQGPEMMCLLTMPKPLSRHGCKCLLLVLLEKHDSSERAGNNLLGKSFKDGYPFPSGFRK